MDHTQDHTEWDFFDSEENDHYPLTVITTGQGSVTSDPAGITCGGDCAEDYPAGTAVTLTATPDSGWQFLGWGGACTGTAACTLTLDGARTITANFAALNNRFQLDSPVHGSPESGIGVVSGWVCEASRVMVQIDDRAAFEAAYGAASTASLDVCGDTANGFAAAINWGDYGDGDHTLTLLADDVALTSATVTVTTLGTAYARGLTGQTDLTDFPSAGLNTTLTWSEPHQNFVVATPAATDASGIAASQATTGHWESPLPDGQESGRSLLRGWTCTTTRVGVRIDGALLEVPYGSGRDDTANVCGDSNNGYAIAMDWTALGDGAHRIELLLDGAVAETRAVTVTTPGGWGTVSGVQRREIVSDFPAAGDRVTLQWSEPAQNFRIVAFQRGTAPEPRETVTHPDLAGAARSLTSFQFSVPAGATDLQLRTFGGEGNVDLHAQAGQPPTRKAAVCRSREAGTAESCAIAAPVAGDYYVVLQGVTAYTGVTLEASWQP